MPEGNDPQNYDPLQPSAKQLHELVELYATGKLDRAEETAERLIGEYPQNATVYNILGAVLAAQGRFDEAIERYARALEIKPDYSEAHSNLGVAHKQKGQLDEAISCQKRALEIDPESSSAHSNLAAALQQKGQIEEAVESYRAGLRLAPEFLEDYINLGIALHDLGRSDEAAASFREAIKREPDFVEAHYNLGNVLLDMGEPDDAIASYQRAVKIHPEHANAHNNMGNAYKMVTRFDEAVASYRRSLEVHPGHANAHDNMGNIHMELGQLDEAVASYRKALEIHPSSGEMHRHLANARKHVERDDEVARAVELYEHAECPPSEKMHLAFALGKAFEDLKEYDQAFEYLSEGNRLKRITFGYSSEDVAGYFAQLKEIFSRSFVEERQQGGNGRGTPVFILGMPRSGTTLAEQMLASHPDIFGAGELDDFSQLMEAEIATAGTALPEGLAELDAAALERIADRYLDRLKGLGGDVPHVTDKTPHNFLNVGLIRVILPSARIIHMRRNAMDTCFSLYANYFVASHLYAWDLTELGQYYRQYEGLMNHWREVLPDAMIEVDYETLVEQPEEQIRRLLDWCGLSYDPACLDFHKSDRIVRTASAAQVRQPLYTSSMQRWRNFEKHLAPLKQALKA